MTMEKSIVWTRLTMVAMLGVGLASCRKDTTVATQSSLSQPHGELISAAPVSENSTNDLSKRKHPKPPSVQRRMVLAELAMASPSNAGQASLSSGTAGSAADLAKTNLPSITSLPVPNLRLPGYQNITFALLAGFAPELADDAAHSTSPAELQIPASVQSLDGSKVVVEGFLLPVRMNNGLAVEFLLMRNQSMCCYGVPPKINEWITVQVAGQGVKPIMDQPIAVAGVLHVGPILENGALAGIYRLDADKISAPF